MDSIRASCELWQSKGSAMETIITLVTVGNSPSGANRKKRTSAVGDVVPGPGPIPLGNGSNQTLPVTGLLSNGYLPQGMLFAYISGIPQPTVISLSAWSGLNPPNVKLGTSNVLITFFCSSGGGGVFDGVYIDAFDVGSGQYINNDFVSVSPDPGKGLTATANTLGTVNSSTNSTLNITADPSLSNLVEDTTAGMNVNVPGTLQFRGWLPLVPNPAVATYSSSTPNVLVLQPSATSSASFLALYKTIPVVSGDAGNISPQCGGLLGRIQMLEKILNEENQNWQNSGSLSKQNPMNGPLASAVSQYTQEYLASGCVFPLAGGVIPKA
jgi:hypothetical protein